MEVQTRVVTAGEIGANGGSNLKSDNDQNTSICPRCENTTPVRLEKADPQANTCYRCRACGHIFSPRD